MLIFLTFTSLDSGRVYDCPLLSRRWACEGSRGFCASSMVWVILGRWRKRALCSVSQLLRLDGQVKALEEPGRYSWSSLCARLGDACWVESVLEIWDFNPDTINSLTQQQLLDDVNSVTVRYVTTGMCAAVWDRRCQRLSWTPRQQ